MDLASTSSCSASNVDWLPFLQPCSKADVQGGDAKLVCRDAQRGQKIATALLNRPSTTDLTATVNLKTTPADVGLEDRNALLGQVIQAVLTRPGP